MFKPSAQLTLSLSLKDDSTFDNFFCAKNNEIVTELKKTISGKGERFIYICGNRGQGCTHLLQACCHEAHAQQLRSVYLPCSSLLSFPSEILSGLESLDLVCVDDLQLIGGHTEWEEAIFYLYNRIFEADGKIIIAANDLPRSINLGLEDLISRLSWGMVYQLHPLNDNEKLAALIMRAKRRGINLPEDVGRYLLTHCPRHMGTLYAALEVLDKASLAAQRRLTIPFVKAVLEI